MSTSKGRMRSERERFRAAGTARRGQLRYRAIEVTYLVVLTFLIVGAIRAVAVTGVDRSFPLWAWCVLIAGVVILVCDYMRVLRNITRTLRANWILHKAKGQTR